MLNGRTLVLCALAFVSTHQFRLPPKAIVIVGHRYYGRYNQQPEDCKYYTLTAAKVRVMFKTYHPITESEMHDDYSFSDCGIRGTVKVGGKIFHWDSDPGNTMTTDYPDGVERTLGGKHSGELGDDGSN